MTASPTRAARRTGRPSRPLPEFLVSAPHRVATLPGSPHPSLPHGAWHARRVGEARTACGLSAVSWPFFWTLRFEAPGARACPACVQSVYLSSKESR